MREAGESRHQVVAALVRGRGRLPGQVVVPDPPGRVLSVIFEGMYR